MIKRKMILSMSKDAKTVKSLKLGYLTGILYLAPHKIAGKNICPNAENAGCVEACLYTAGRGGFNSVQTARINKTLRFHEDNNNFMLDLIYSINRVIKKADKEGLIPCIRLNGTSDIIWEKYKVDGKTLFEIFPDVQFYDYTKIPQTTKFKNYHLTFSYSEANPIYKKSVIKALDLAMNIAVVFIKSAYPKTFLGYEVVDGDKTDLRFLDGDKKVIALSAKGKAKKDTSGFVVHPEIIPTF